MMHQCRSHLSKVILHIIFSTKERYPWLDVNVRSRMHAYVATVCREEGAQAFRVGGVADHIHLVITLPRTVSQAQMIEGLKKKSSKWIKSLAPAYRKFYWQRGYGAFSVSPSQLGAVVEYVARQEEQHRSHTFQEEYREFLRKNGVDYDERYVWIEGAQPHLNRAFSAWVFRSRCIPGPLAQAYN